MSTPRPAINPQKFVFAVCLFWALFQLWYVSPLPYWLGVGMLNSTEARSLHLAIALFLTFLIYPRWRNKPTQPPGIVEWILAIVGAVSAGYLYWNYDALVARIGKATVTDIVIGLVGLLVLLEALRRSLALPAALLVLFLLVHVFWGKTLPDALAEPMPAIGKFIHHFWLTNEAVFGAVMGVSTTALFPAVILGCLVDRIKFAHPLVDKVFQPFTETVNGSIPKWLEARFWTWVFGIFTVIMMQGVGLQPAPTLPIDDATLLMLAALIWWFRRLRNKYQNVLSAVGQVAVISVTLSVLYLFRLPMVLGLAIVLVAIFRETMAPSNPERNEGVRRSWLAITESLVFGFTLIYFVAHLLVTIGISLGYGFDADIAPYVLVGAVFLFSLIGFKHPRRVDFVTFVAIVGSLLWLIFVERLSPGLSVFYAVAVGLVLLFFRRLLSGLSPDGPAMGKLFAKAIEDISQPLANGARNMIPISMAAAGYGIIIGSVTLLESWSDISRFLIYIVFR